METTKREIIKGAPIRDAPGHYRIIVTIEDDNERSWDVVRKPDGTYWDVASVDICPLRIALGDQIVDAKALRLCEQNYRQLREAEAATLKVLGLRKVPGTDPQKYELRLYDAEEKTRGYFQTTKYGTEEEIRAMLNDGGLTEGQIEFYLARA